MKYAKLIDGDLILAPNPLLVGANYIGNPPGSVYEAEGYKPVVYTDPPTVEEGYIAVPGWDEEDDEIVQTWSIEEEPDEVDDERAMEILFGGEGE